MEAMEDRSHGLQELARWGATLKHADPSPNCPSFCRLERSWPALDHSHDCLFHLDAHGRSHFEQVLYQ